MSNAYEKMDSMYRYQRYFYDFTRRYYLLGRDQLIAKMSIKPGDRVLEIGCGTGRNLVRLAKLYPDSHFYGLDASAEMLESASSKIRKNGFKNVKLELGLADEFSYSETFGLANKFDTSFFSYSISMIPTWKASIVKALENLKTNEKLFIVDFYDQRDLPKLFAGMLQFWLRQFHVEYPSELIPHLEKLEEKGLGELKIESLFKSYSFIAEFTKSP